MYWFRLTSASLKGLPLMAGMSWAEHAQTLRSSLGMACTRGFLAYQLLLIRKDTCDSHLAQQRSTSD